MDDGLLRLKIAAQQRLLARRLTAIQYLEHQIEQLVRLTEEALSEVESWACYASPYFQEKHGLDDTLEKLNTRLANLKPKAKE